MSEHKFKKVEYTLSGLMNDIRHGSIGLPDIQRPFVWPNTKVRDLLDSIYRGYPVGNLLFWENHSDEHVTYIGTEQKQKVADLLVVDGQQRLTSLYSVWYSVPVFTKEYQTKTVRIAFNPIEEQFEVSNSSTETNPNFISDISKIWTGSVFQERKSFLDRLENTRELTQSEYQAIDSSFDRLNSLKDYPFTALEISRFVSPEDVADVFVRINSQGTKLGTADFILTLMSVFWDEGRRDLEEFCRDAHEIPSENNSSPFNYLIKPLPGQLLRVAIGLAFNRARLPNVYSILRGKDLKTGEYDATRRDEQFARLKAAQSKVLDLQNWHDFLHLKYAQVSGQQTILICAGGNVGNSAELPTFSWASYLRFFESLFIPSTVPLGMSLFKFHRRSII